MMSLTRKQRDLLDFLRLKSSAGEMPSYKEMCAHCGLFSKSGVHRLLVALEERGHIRRIPNRARAIELLDRNQLAGFSAAQLQDELNRRAKAA
jgi:repressor LexA